MSFAENTVVETEYAHTVRQKKELDWLVYNAPLEYAQLVLSGVVHEYLLAITKS